LYFSSLILGALFLLNLPHRRWRESLATGLSIVGTMVAIGATAALFRAAVMSAPLAFPHLGACAAPLPIANPGAGITAILVGLVCGVLHEEIHGRSDRAVAMRALRMATPMAPS